MRLDDSVSLLFLEPVFCYVNSEHMTKRKPFYDLQTYSQRYQNLKSNGSVWFPIWRNLNRLQCEWSVALLISANQLYILTMLTNKYYNTIKRRGERNALTHMCVIKRTWTSTYWSYDKKTATFDLNQKNDCFLWIDRIIAPFPLHWLNYFINNNDSVRFLFHNNNKLCLASSRKYDAS